MHYNHVNQPVMNAPQKMRLKINKENIVVEKEELIMKNDMKNNDIMREKNMKIISNTLNFHTQFSHFSSHTGAQI